MIKRGKHLVPVLVLFQFLIFNMPLHAKDVLSLAISSTKTTYHSGEPIFIETKIINRSEKMVAFISPSGGTGLSYSFEKTKKKDNLEDKLVKRQYSKKGNGQYYEVSIDDLEIGGVYLDGYIPSDKKIIKLKKNEAYSNVFDVSRLLEMVKPGIYKIRIQFDLDEILDSDSIDGLLPPALRQAAGEKIVVHRLESNELSIEVVDQK